MKFLYFLLDIFYIHFLQIFFTAGNTWRPQKACRPSKVDEQERAGHEDRRGTRTGDERRVHPGGTWRASPALVSPRQHRRRCSSRPGPIAPVQSPRSFPSPRTNRPSPIRTAGGWTAPPRGKATQMSGRAKAAPRPQNIIRLDAKQNAAVVPIVHIQSQQLDFGTPMDNQQMPIT